MNQIYFPIIIGFILLNLSLTAKAVPFYAREQHSGHEQREVSERVEFGGYERVREDHEWRERREHHEREEYEEHEEREERRREPDFRVQLQIQDGRVRTFVYPNSEMIYPQPIRRLPYSDGRIYAPQVFGSQPPVRRHQFRPSVELFIEQVKAASFFEQKFAIFTNQIQYLSYEQRRIVREHINEMFDYEDERNQALQYLF